MTTADLPKAADELFTLPPSEFTRRRNELAKELKSGGDKEGAAKLAALPRPSLAAWALNQVARWNAKLISELVRVDESLRNPDSSAEFRKASAERGRILGDIVEAASEILLNNGHSAGAGVRAKLTQTLLAVGTDEDARSDLIAGRLVRDLESGGFGKDAWSLEMPAGPELPDGDGDERDEREAGASQSEDERRKRLAEELAILDESAEKRRREAAEARELASEKMEEAEKAAAAARKAEGAAEDAAEAAELKRRELGALGSAG